MARFHHTNERVIDLTRKYDQTFFKKPLGLWYDIDCSWSDWCRHNDYGEYDNHFLLNVEMTDILVIDTAEKLVQFHDKFSFVPEGFEKVSGDWRQIKWDFLAKHYAGIEIAPYRGEQRGLRGYFWYQIWDIASGCIWDLSVIKSVQKVDIIKAVNS